ncbi:PREDICTED: verprolin-like [Cyprinodon variegatus]|uniref:verprolin-like n=1 Tax=Cyprinodon variegatus TaxID=28743 RepID=UPI00074279F3|nr:PREDICTED: verprolin-like [Cyprinodon variegatus]
MFGLRTKKQMTTKYSPYYIMFGREARYPSEIPQEVEIDSSIEDAVASEKLAQDIVEQILLFEKVRKHLDEGDEKTRNKNKSDSKIVFKVGEKVWRQNLRSQQRKGGKLERSYFGPYFITAIKGKSADLRDEKGIVFNKISTDQLKLAVESTPRVPGAHNHLQPRHTIPAAPPQPSNACSEPAAEAVTPAAVTPPKPSNAFSKPAAEAVTSAAVTPPKPSNACSKPAEEAVTPAPVTPPKPSNAFSKPAAEAVTPAPLIPPQPSNACSKPAAEAVTPAPVIPPQPSNACSKPAAEAVTPAPVIPPQPSNTCSEQTYTTAVFEKCKNVFGSDL